MNKPKIAEAEFIALMALLSSLTALAIDAILPATSEITAAFQPQQITSTPLDSALLVTILVLGMGFGEPLFGPLSDHFGRLKVINIGIVIFCIGAGYALIANSFIALLVARFIQGFGVAGVKIASRALVRDLYEGADMARIMSLMMGVFITVPFVAPFIGQGILMLWGWQSIFGVFLLVALVSFVWLNLRQGETLQASHNIPFSMANIWRNGKAILSIRSVMLYTLVAGLSFSCMVIYISTLEPLLGEEFGIGDSFPLFFGVNAIGLGIAFFINARLVKHWGMAPMVYLALVLMLVASLGYLVPVALGVHYGLVGFCLWCFFGLFATGIIFGNINALAMQHLGAMAGIGASVIAALSSFVAFAVSAGVNALPVLLSTGLFIGFLLCALASLLALRLGQSYERQEQPVNKP